MDSVFGFIARELESFVVSATGAPQHGDDDDDGVRPDPPPKRRRGREPEQSQASKRRRHRSKSVTMPGSLYPRSPSLDPATPKRVVRFTPTPGPSKSPSPVKAAIQRFRVDADPSILLPAHRTPESALSAKARGKQRALDDGSDFSSPEHSGELRVRGKERELQQALQRQLENETRRDFDQSFAEKERERDKERIRELEQEIRILRDELARHSSFNNSASLNNSASFLPPPAPPPPPPPPPPPNQSILRLPAVVDDPNTLFATARASLRNRPIPNEKPINPPHVSRRKGQPTIGVTPDKMAAFLHEMKSVRLRKTGRDLDSSNSFSSGSGLSFNSTRSDESTSIGEDASFLPRSLTGPPPSRSIHSASRTGVKRRDTLDMLDVGPRHDVSSKRTLLPAVRLASEMHPPTQPSSSTSSTSPTGLFSGASSSSTEPATSDQGVSVPRLPLQQTQTKEPEPPGLTPSLSSDDPEKEDEHDQPPSTPPQIIPSRSVYRFRGTGIPVTPLERSRSSTSLISRKVPFPQPEDLDYEQIQEQTPGNTQPTDYEDSFIPLHPTTPEDPSNALVESTVFKRRLPVSPLPSKSPRKPQPPKRRRSTPHPKKLSLTHDHEEPLPMLSFSIPPAAVSTPSLNTQVSTKPFLDTPISLVEPPTSRGRLPPSRIPIRSSRLRSSSRSRSRSVSFSSRLRSDSRLTLDEELWIAQQSDEVEVGGGMNDEDPADDFYVGSGTRDKKRGFLAHGGAGGMPLFMGVGSVDGAEEEHEREDVLHPPNSTTES